MCVCLDPLVRSGDQTTRDHLQWLVIWWWIIPSLDAASVLLGNAKLKLKRETIRSDRAPRRRETSQRNVIIILLIMADRAAAVYSFDGSFLMDVAYPRRHLLTILLLFMNMTVSKCLYYFIWFLKFVVVVTDIAESRLLFTSQIDDWFLGSSPWWIDVVLARRTRNAIRSPWCHQQQQLFERQREQTIPWLRQRCSEFYVKVPKQHVNNWRRCYQRWWT